MRGAAIPSSDLIRWCGVAAVLAGALWEGWGGILFLAPEHFHYFVVFAALVVPSLFLVALVGLYVALTAQRRALGGMELILARMGLFVALCASVWGASMPISDIASLLHIYLAERGFPPYLMDWLPYLCIASVVIGVAALTAKAPGRWSLAPLAVGLSGLIFYATDFGASVEFLLANIAFGVLFGLSWVVLGYALWRQAGGRQQNFAVD